MKLSPSLRRMMGKKMSSIFDLGRAVCRWNTDLKEMREGLVLSLKDKPEWEKLVCFGMVQI